MNCLLYEKAKKGTKWDQFELIQLNWAKEDIQLSRAAKLKNISCLEKFDLMPVLKEEEQKGGQEAEEQGSQIESSAAKNVRILKGMVISRGEQLKSQWVQMLLLIQMRF